MMPLIELTYVAQPPRSKLCGAACCAMVLGKTLEQVLSEIDWRRLTWTCGVVEYLARNEVLTQLATYKYLPRGQISLVAIGSSRLEGMVHWTVWSGVEQWLDPVDGELDPYENQPRIVDVWPLVYVQQPDPMPEWARDLPERWEDSLL